MGLGLELVTAVPIDDLPLLNGSISFSVEVNISADDVGHSFTGKVTFSCFSQQQNQTTIPLLHDPATSTVVFDQSNNMSLFDVLRPD